MLAGISHDLRTPLTRIKLQIALLKDKNASNSIKKDVEEMKEMINSYLAFAKGEGEEKIENENIYSFFKNIVKNSNNPKKIKVKTKNIKKYYIFCKTFGNKESI